MRERDMRCREPLVFRRLRYSPLACHTRSHVRTVTCFVFFPTDFWTKEISHCPSCYLFRYRRPFTFPLLIVTCFSVYSRWAHIGCAVAMPEVFFVNVNLREGINTDQITSARRKLVSSPDFFLFNRLGKVNVCLCNCVLHCSLQHSFLFCHALLYLPSYALI